jgi:hypothetical protein
MKNLNEPRRPVQPEAEVIPLESRRAAKLESSQQLIEKRDVEDLRARWTVIQANFVDDPRKAVQEADGLVSSAIQQISENFRSQRAQLETKWSKGGDTATEDLRMLLQSYRSFFDRLLSM